MPRQEAQLRPRSGLGSSDLQYRRNNMRRWLLNRAQRWWARRGTPSGREDLAERVALHALLLTQAFRGPAHRLTRERLVALDAGAARSMANANVAAQATAMLGAVRDALRQHAPADAAALEAKAEAEAEAGAPAAAAAAAAAAATDAARLFAWLPELSGLVVGDADYATTRGEVPTSSTSATAGAIRDHLVSTVGFVLRVAPSTVPSAAVGDAAGGGPGRGVFVHGSVRAGAVVGFSPGTIYTGLDLAQLLKIYVARGQRKDPAAKLHDADLYEALVLQNEHFFAEQRLDGVVLDAHPARNPFPGCLHGNPYALSHMVNHPSAAAGARPKAATTRGGQPLRPNVLSFDFDVPSSFPHKQFMPNVYSGSHRLLDRVEPQDAWRFLHSRVLLATEDLDDGVELLVDYRLNPAASLPAWYAPVDKDTDAQRWRDF